MSSLAIRAPIFSSQIGYEQVMISNEQENGSKKRRDMSHFCSEGAPFLSNYWFRRDRIATEAYHNAQEFIMRNLLSAECSAILAHSIKLWGIYFLSAYKRLEYNREYRIWSIQFSQIGDIRLLSLVVEFMLRDKIPDCLAEDIKCVGLGFNSRRSPFFTFSRFYSSHIFTKNDLFLLLGWQMVTAKRYITIHKDETWMTERSLFFAIVYS